MDLLWVRSTGVLKAGEAQMRAWSKTRNELNGLRPNEDRVKSGNPDVFFITRQDGSKGPASMPRPFPAGRWTITGINAHPDKEHDGYLYPFFIATDAHQPLEIWETDGNGNYLRNTHILEEDYAYGAHFSTSDWTTGCIRVATEADIRWLVKNVKVGDPFIAV